MSKSCPRCGEPLEPSDRNCPSCGDDPGEHDPYSPGTAFLVEDVAPEQGDDHSGPYRPDPDFRYQLPYSVGSMLGATMGLWRESAGRLTGLFLLAGVIELVVDLWMSSQGATGDFGSGMWNVGGLFSFPVATAAWAGTFVMLDERLRFGRHSRRVLGCLGQGFRFFGSFFGLGFMMGLAMIPAILPGAIFAGLEIYVVGVPLLMAGAVVDVYLLVRWSVANAVIVAEGNTATGSMPRSSQLLKGSLWKAFGFLVVAILIMGGMIGLVAIVIFVATWALGIPELYGDLALNLFSTVAAGPFLYVATFVLYAAARSREVSVNQTGR